MVGFGALGLRDALRKQDRSGMEKSRAERGISLAGSTIGGLLGVGLATHGGGARPSGLGMMAGGLGGAILGDKLLTSPFAKARAHRAALAQRQQPQPQQPEYAHQQAQGVPA